MRREPPAHQWHARGQGFQSPQLHQAQRITHHSERRLPAICQQMTQSVRIDALRHEGCRSRAASAVARTTTPGARRAQPPLGRPSPGWCAGSELRWHCWDVARPARPLAWCPISSSMTRAGMPASSSQVEKVCRRSCGPAGPSGPGRPRPRPRRPCRPAAGCWPVPAPKRLPGAAAGATTTTHAVVLATTNDLFISAEA